MAYDEIIDEDTSEYGEVKAYYKKWGDPSDGKGTTYHELKTRKCSEEELGLTGDEINSKFWKLPSKSEIEPYKHLLRCVD